MCWNAEVSLNTFLFSAIVLSLVIYNNSFTKYKIQELNDKWMYVFIISVILMQLIEFFIWKNVNNKFYNNIFSMFAAFLLVIQPITSLMLLKNIQLRNLLLILYSSLAIPYSVYKSLTNNIHSIITKAGHLKWNLFGGGATISMIWFFFFLFSFVYERKWFGLIFGVIALIMAYLNNNIDGSVWSMWCWGVNLLAIYYAIYIMIYLPFLDI